MLRSFGSFSTKKFFLGLTLRYCCFLFPECPKDIEVTLKYDVDESWRLALVIDSLIQSVYLVLESLNEPLEHIIREVLKPWQLRQEVYFLILLFHLYP